MDWIQTLSIIATVIGCAYYMHRDIMSDIKHTNARLDASNLRTDRLYEMYCESNQRLDERLSDYRKESDKKFYDLLKEIKK